jgi:putative membrane protein
MAPAAEIDKRYLEAQIASHEELLTMHRAYAMGGEHEPLKAYANDMVGRFEREVERAKQMMPR